MTVAAGIRLDLSSLPARNRRALVKLMARISEASYRRGLLHAVLMALFVAAPAVSDRPDAYETRANHSEVSR